MSFPKLRQPLKFRTNAHEKLSLGLKNMVQRDATHFKSMITRPTIKKMNQIPFMRDVYSSLHYTTLTCFFFMLCQQALHYYLRQRSAIVHFVSE